MTVKIKNNLDCKIAHIYFLRTLRTCVESNERYERSGSRMKTRCKTGERCETICNEDQKSRLSPRDLPPLRHIRSRFQTVSYIMKAPPVSK